jgi:hypothetical protein
MPSSARPTTGRGGAELGGRSRPSQLVRLTARTSAVLFATAQAASAIPPGRRVSRGFYAAFLAAHAVHFVAVARYAVRTGGHNLFPGGRSLADVGGWRTMAGIYVAFAGLAVIGWLAHGPSVHRGWLSAAGRAANGVIAAMFASVYLQRILVREPAD